MSMVLCGQCGQSHHINDFCASYGEVAPTTVRSRSMPMTTTQAPEYESPDFAPMTHVPDMERRAENQRPKSRDWHGLRLMRYDGTDLYQWYGKQGLSPFEVPDGGPFMIRALSVSVNGQGSGSSADADTHRATGPAVVVSRLSEDERRVLLDLDRYYGDDFGCYDTATIASNIGYSVELTRAVIKCLVVRGLLELHKGLLTEEGRAFGSGYCCSAEGHSLARKIAAQQAPISDDTQPSGFAVEHDLEALREKVKAALSRLRKTRISDYPGGPRVHEGLGWENLDEVTDAILSTLLSKGG